MTRATYHWLRQPDILTGPIPSREAAMAQSNATIAEYYAANSEYELRNLYYFRQPGRDSIADVALSLSHNADLCFALVNKAIEAWYWPQHRGTEDAPACREYVYRAFDAYLVAHYFAVYMRQLLEATDPECVFLRHLTHYDHYTEAEQEQVSNVFLSCAGPVLAGL